MGLFKDSFDAFARGDPKDVTVASFRQEIWGELYYQENLRRILEEHGREVTARLLLDEDNPRDVNAVRVEIKGLKVGELPPEDCLRFHSSNCPHTCPALVRVHEAQEGGVIYGVGLELKLE